MSGEPTYPFVAKSTAFLIPGHFWDIPLSNGKFGCGRVLFTATSPDVSDRFGSSPLRVFVGGVLDWSSTQLPTADVIAGCSLIGWGQLHVAGLSDAGSLIRGWRDLEADGLRGLKFADSNFGGNLYEDGRFVETLPRGYHEELPTITTWGRSIMKNLAELRFGFTAAH